MNDDVLTRVQALQPVADELGLSMAQLAVAWVLQNDNVAAALIGASPPRAGHRERQGRRREDPGRADGPDRRGPRRRRRAGPPQDQGDRAPAARRLTRRTPRPAPVPLPGRGPVPRPGQVTSAPRVTRRRSGSGPGRLGVDPDGFPGRGRAGSTHDHHPRVPGRSAAARTTACSAGCVAPSPTAPTSTSASSASWPSCLSLLGGAAVPVYLAAWLLIPEEGESRSPAERLLSR